MTGPGREEGREREKGRGGGGWETDEPGVDAVLLKQRWDQSLARGGPRILDDRLLAQRREGLVLGVVSGGGGGAAEHDGEPGEKTHQDRDALSAWVGI